MTSNIVTTERVYGENENRSTVIVVERLEIQIDDESVREIVEKNSSGLVRDLEVARACNPPPPVDRRPHRYVERLESESENGVGLDASLHRFRSLYFSYAHFLPSRWLLVAD